MEYTLDRNNSRLDIAERLCELDAIAIEIIQNKTHTYSEKPKQPISELWDNCKQPNICIIGVSKGGR